MSSEGSCFWRKVRYRWSNDLLIADLCILTDSLFALSPLCLLCPILFLVFIVVSRHFGLSRESERAISGDTCRWSRSRGDDTNGFVFLWCSASAWAHAVSMRKWSKLLSTVLLEISSAGKPDSDALELQLQYSSFFNRQRILHLWICWKRINRSNNNYANWWYCY